MWKKHSRSIECPTPDFTKIHNEEEELHTPRVGGMIIWVTVLLTTLVFYFAAQVFPSAFTEKMNFFSRNQTFIPLFTLLIGSVIGFWDDLIQIYGSGSFARDDASWRKWKATLVALLSFFIGSWFYYKLGLTSIHIPFGGELFLGVLIIPAFMIVSLATFFFVVLDGIDVLAGGVMASIFAAYSAIAFANNQIDLAAFSGVVAGVILVFLWFNIPPARFYMGETGIMGLTITIATLAFLTDSVLILPVVAMPLVVTTASVLLQFASKKWRGKRFFRLAPLHHHLMAIGWSQFKVTMRFWVLSVVFAIIGVILAIVS